MSKIIHLNSDIKSKKDAYKMIKITSIIIMAFLLFIMTLQTIYFETISAGAVMGFFLMFFILFKKSRVASTILFTLLTLDLVYSGFQSLDFLSLCMRFLICYIVYKLMIATYRFWKYKTLNDSL